MPAYVVALPDNLPGLTLIENHNSIIVFAASTNDAKAMAKMAFDGDGNGPWDSATVTEIVAATDLEGFTLRVVVEDASPVIVAETVGDSGDGIDEIGADMVTVLNANAQIANAAYDSGTNILTIAGVADALGDKSVKVEVYPPTGSNLQVANQSLTSFVGTITDEGIAAAALSVVLVDSTAAQIIDSGRV